MLNEDILNEDIFVDGNSPAVLSIRNGGVCLYYCHPNMSNNELFEYTRSLEKIYESIKKENPMVSIFCGDFNTRSTLFWEGDTENKEVLIFKPPWATHQ